MNSPLVIVLSCQKNKNSHELIKHKFIENKIDFVIITGGNKKTEYIDNELRLKCEDTYEALHLKTLEALKYINSHIKRDILKIDDDSLLNFKAFKKYKFNFDYGGFILPGSGSGYAYHKEKVSNPQYSSDIDDSNINYYFALGGCYFLSKKAIKFVVKNAQTTFEYKNFLKKFKGREDRMVGQALFDSFKLLNVYSEGYWINRDNVLYSVFNDMVLHPIPLSKLEYLYNKKYPKFLIYK